VTTATTEFTSSTSTTSSTTDGATDTTSTVTSTSVPGAAATPPGPPPSGANTDANTATDVAQGQGVAPAQTQNQNQAPPPAATSAAGTDTNTPPPAGANTNTPAINTPAQPPVNANANGAVAGGGAAAAPDNRFSRTAADTDTATRASSPTDAAVNPGDSATARDGNPTAPAVPGPPAATVGTGTGTDSQTQTEAQTLTNARLGAATGAPAAVPTNGSGSGSGSGSGAGSGSSAAATNGSGGSSSLVHKPAFIGALVGVGVVLALILFFVVLRCRRSHAARKGRKLDAEMDAAFRKTVEKEKAFDVESGAGGELYRAQSTQSAMSASYTLPPLTVAIEQQPQYNFFAQQGPYSAAPDHANPSRRGSAYLAAAPANAYVSGDPVPPHTSSEPQFKMVMPPRAQGQVQMQEPDEPEFEMVTPAVLPQAQAYPQDGPARTELHRRPTQQHAYPAQEHAHAHQSGLAQRPSLTAVIHLSRPASPAGHLFESAEKHGRPMTEIPLSPPDAYPNPYAGYAA
jgi:hypothetical protein